MDKNLQKALKCIVVNSNVYRAKGSGISTQVLRNIYSDINFGISTLEYCSKRYLYSGIDYFNISIE